MSLLRRERVIRYLEFNVLWNVLEFIALECFRITELESCDVVVVR